MTPKYRDETRVYFFFFYHFIDMTFFFQTKSYLPFIYILFGVFENSETSKRGELIRQIPEGGETISFEFSTTSISLGEWRLS